MTAPAFDRYVQKELACLRVQGVHTVSGAAELLGEVGQLACGRCGEGDSTVGV